MGTGRSWGLEWPQPRTAPVAGVSARAGRPRPVRRAAVIFDAHPGLVAAIGTRLPRAAWQPLIRQHRWGREVPLVYLRRRERASLAA